MEALRGYESDGSDSSEGGGRDPGSPPEAKRARPALPGAELALAGGAEALAGAPGLAGGPPAGHQGRVRSFPHVHGQYATTVYLPVPLAAPDRAALERLFRELRGGVPGLHLIAGPDEKAVHVSLSRTVPLTEDRIRPLLDALHAALRGAEPVRVSFERTSYFANDERTRGFAALDVREGAAAVRALIAKVDGVFAAFGLATFYEDPKPHASFAWTVERGADSALRALVGEGAGDCAGHVFRAEIPAVHCRVGHVVWLVWPALRPK